MKIGLVGLGRMGSNKRIEAILDRAPVNDAPIGWIKVTTRSGWFAARPSSTESIYKIHAESFRGKEHLARIVEDAQAMLNAALGAKPR